MLSDLGLNLIKPVPKSDKMTAKKWLDEELKIKEEARLVQNELEKVQERREETSW